MSLIRVDNIADQDGDNAIGTYQMIAILKNISELFAMLASSDPAEVLNAQKAFGMGSAAALDYGTAVGNALRMTSTGVFGLGQTTTGNFLTSIDATDTPAGFYNYTSATTGGLPTGTTFGTLIVIRGATTNGGVLITQLAINIDNNNIQSRNYVGNAWSAWKTFYTQAIIDDVVWTAATLGNNWVRYSDSYATPQYKKVGSQVFLRGLMKSGTLNTAAFTLPSGMRPTFPMIISTISNNGGADVNGRVDITTSGLVTPVSGSNNTFSLENISFWTN